MNDQERPEKLETENHTQSTNNEPLKETYPKDFDEPNREFNARIVPFVQNVLTETIESLQDEAAIREATLSGGTKTQIGPRLLKELIAVVDSRSGVIAETDDQGNVKLQATFPETDKKGRVKRSRFYTGLCIEAVTLDAAFKSIDLRQRGREPRDLEIKNQTMALAKDTSEEAQRKGEEIDRKIINENYEYKPPYLQPPLQKSVRLEPEIALNPDLIGRLTSFANYFIREKGGRSIEQVKIQLARFTEHSVIARASGSTVDQLIPRTSLSIWVKTTKGSEAFGALRGSCGSLGECLSRYQLQPAQKEEELFSIVGQLCQQVLAEASDLDRAEGAGILGSRCPVILSPEVAGVFAHECFGHPAEGDIIYENTRDQSAQIKLKSRLGSQISENDKFTVVDTPNPILEFSGNTVHRFNWGSFVVDRYGELAKDCIIVEKGNMVEAMTNHHTHEYVISGLRPEVVERMNRRGLSGSSRHETFSVKPLIRMRNTFIFPDPNGAATKEEMAAKFQEFKVKKGVYLQSCKGGWVDTRNGTFCINGNLGYLIENGTVTIKPIKDVQVTGKLGDILALVGGLGNVSSMNRTFTGFCGKDNQWVPVDGGGPIVFLKEAQIGGGSIRHWSEIVADYANQLEEVKIGKRSHEQIILPEVENLRLPGEPTPHICLSTVVLPFETMARIVTGERRLYATHEVIYDPVKERYRVVAREDRHAL